MQPVIATSRPVGGFSAFIAAVFVFAGVINGAMLHRPAVAASIKTASWLDPNKPHQDRLPVKAIPTIAYRLDVASVTATPQHSLPWSCETIRNAVANLTSEQVERLARLYRLSKWQRAEAKRCLKEKV